MAKQKVIDVESLLEVPIRRQPTWFDTLSAEQREQCLNACKLIHERQIPHRVVARQWIEKLGLSVSPQTVANWIRQNGG